VRVVEEAVDPAGPRGGVEVGLRVSGIARRAAVGGTVPGGRVAHVDRSVEVLRPESDAGDVVAGFRLRAQALQRVAGEPKPRREVLGSARIHGEPLIEVAVRRDVELLLLRDVRLDAGEPCHLVQCRDRRPLGMPGPLHDEVCALDPDLGAGQAGRPETAGRRLHDDLPVHQPLRRRDHVHGEAMKGVARLPERRREGPHRRGAAVGLPDVRLVQRMTEGRYRIGRGAG